jgi:hypothetical protein
VQRAEDFGEPLQVAVERRGGILRTRGAQAEACTTRRNKQDCR